MYTEDNFRLRPHPGHTGGWESFPKADMNPSDALPAKADSGFAHAFYPVEARISLGGPEPDENYVYAIAL